MHKPEQAITLRIQNKPYIFHLKSIEPSQISKLVGVSSLNHRDQNPDLRDIAEDIRKNGQVQPAWGYEDTSSGQTTYCLVDGSRRMRVAMLYNLPFQMLVTSKPIPEKALFASSNKFL